MLKISRLGLAIATGLVGVLVTKTALADFPYVEANGNGDYYIINELRPGSVYARWTVVDPDPNGLNVRCAQSSYQGPDFYNLRPSFTVRNGESFTSSHLRFDDRGLPWVQIKLENAGRETCFVRANSQYVLPSRIPIND